jgi:metal-responsive CopG/Arc/MetJ family transcriptional regulator
MNVKTIKRNTKVLSVSLDPSLVLELIKFSKTSGQNKSSIVSNSIKSYLLNVQWEELKKYGRKKARELGITSEEDVYRIMGDA